jgi:hypothetical protein
LPSRQPGLKGGTMAAIEVIAFAAAAGFAFVFAMTIIVIIGVHREERYLTLLNKTAPGAMALIARIVLGRYVRKELDWTIERRRDELIRARERTASSRR